jgi:hypothetical protein
MTSGVDHLAAKIDAHLREWAPHPTHVELAIFETDKADVIARTIDQFCIEQLGEPVAGGLFHQSSIGSVTGVTLCDRRAVVIKAHQPERPRKFLSEIVRIESFLFERKLFAPQVLAGPSSLGHGLAIVERFAEVGGPADAHDPDIRRALARALHTIVRACGDLVATTSLEPSPLPSSYPDLWPKPHSKLFDFERTKNNAIWIDEIAAVARERTTPAGERVIGHSDWRQEHVWFVGHEPVVAFDWDSLMLQYEAALVGMVTHGFCADWSRSGHRQAPSLEEASAFVNDYQTARERRFSADERALCAACFTYACAYTARCGQSIGVDERATPGTFPHLLWTERARLFDL